MAIERDAEPEHGADEVGGCARRRSPRGQRTAATTPKPIVVITLPPWRRPAAPSAAGAVAAGAALATAAPPRPALPSGLRRRRRFLASAGVLGGGRLLLDLRRLLRLLEHGARGPTTAVLSLRVRAQPLEIEDEVLARRTPGISGSRTMTMASLLQTWTHSSHWMHAREIEDELVDVRALLAGDRRLALAAALHLDDLRRADALAREAADARELAVLVVGEREAHAVALGARADDLGELDGRAACGTTLRDRGPSARNASMMCPSAVLPARTAPTRPRGARGRRRSA